MRGVRLILSMSLLLVISSPLLAVDLTKLERRLAKEPAYRSKNPKYCLLVFGPEAEKRVWLVLDGDVLYADSNGNSDLTEPGERVTPSAFGQIPGTEDPKLMQREFKVGAVEAADRKSKHTLLVRHFEQRGETTYGVEVLIGGKFEQFAAVSFTARPADAPVAWFDGPLTMRPYGTLVGLPRGEKPRTLSFAVAIPGLGATTVIAYPDLIPETALPEASIEFPGERPGLPPIKVKLRFEKRC